MTDLVLFRLGWIGCLDIPKVHSQGHLDVNLSNCNSHVNNFSFHLISHSYLPDSYGSVLKCVFPGRHAARCEKDKRSSPDDSMSRTRLCMAKRPTE